MAEFLTGTKREKRNTTVDAGFDAMGKPVPFYRREAGYQHCKNMGLTNEADMMACVDGMADRIQRDEPYRAMEVGMQYLDLIGTYRLMAVLCTAQKEPVHAS